MILSVSGTGPITSETTCSSDAECQGEITCTHEGETYTSTKATCYTYVKKCQCGYAYYDGTVDIE